MDFKTRFIAGNGENDDTENKCNEDIGLEKNKIAAALLCRYRGCPGKKIEMIKTKELLPLTGYVHGGCSPAGMKKFLQTVVDETRFLWQRLLSNGTE